MEAWLSLVLQGQSRGLTGTSKYAKIHVQGIFSTVHSSEKNRNKKMSIGWLKKALNIHTMNTIIKYCCRETISWNHIHETLLNEKSRL